MKSVAACLVCCSCGTVTADLLSLPPANPAPRPSVADASPNLPDAGSNPDSGASLGEAPFSTPTLIAGLAVEGFHSDDPTLPEDQLELYFSSNRRPSAKYDVWRVSRLSVNAVWGPATLVRELSSTEGERTPAISDDGLRIWFSSERPAPPGFDGGLNIWRSERAQRSEPWSEPVFEAQLSSAGVDLAAHVAESALFAIVSQSVAGGSNDLFSFNRKSGDDLWGEALPLTELNSMTTDEGTVRRDGLLLVFSSAGGASRDLYLAKRKSLDDPFSAPVPLTELNSPTLDTDPWVSKDLSTIVFSSDRDGLQQFYEAKRAAPGSR